MALDPSIPLGIKPMQIESPLNQMAKMYEMQNAVQANKLNQMKMDEYTRGVAEAEQFKNALAQANDETSIRNAFYAKGDVKGYNDYLKSLGEQKKLDIETTNLGYTGKKTQGEIAKQRQEFDNQAKRDLSFNPSDENIKAFSQDAVLKGIYTQEEAARATAQLLSIPINQRQAFLAGQGATAGDLSTAATAKAGQAITMRGQDITAKTTREGQLMTDARERERIRQGDRRDVVSNQQVSEDGTVTSFNKFGEIIGTVKGVGKPSAQFTKSKEQSKKLNTDLTLAITELTNATKDGGLIDQSTGSGAGRAYDVAQGFFGYTNEGAIAGAKLGPIADLALKMVPRFEGPQSDKDTQSYKEAAGQLANTSLPNEIRKEAGKTVLRLMKNRKNQFVTQEMAQEGVVPSAGGDVDASNPLLN
jgi:hypothetical protein